MAYDRFTFHLDPSGGQTGFREAQEARAQAGIGLTVMCADTYGPIWESIQISQQYNVPLTAVWRPSTAGQNTGFNFDVPGENYTMPVQAAADMHYAARTLASAPYPSYAPQGGGGEPSVPPDCIPREDYRAVVDLVPQDTTAAEIKVVVDGILKSKGTITHSHNDARKVAALGNARSLVRIWNPARQPHAIPAMQEWGVAYEVRQFGGNPPPPPPRETYDLLDYMKGQNGFHAELQYTWAGGGTHPIQVQYGQDGVFCYVKGHSGEYEMLYADDNFIYRGIDTSEANDRLYTQNTRMGADVIYGAVWANRRMSIGETVAKNPWIEHWFQTTPPTFDRAAQVQDTLTLQAHHPSFAFPSGLTIQDVLFLTWNGSTEGYYFAKGKGLVGFVFSGGQSYISEIHNHRPNLTRNPVQEWENRARYYRAV